MKFLSSLSLILSRVAMLQVLWKNWDIRSFLIASFTFQVILIVAAPLRKRSSDLITRASLWASYLLADWVAAQAIGLIIRATEPGYQSVTDDDGYLFSFWAQFLLVHLGGPDTIIALALEDNELWLRTALHLAVQAYGSLGVLFRSTRSSGLWVATVLMFLAGIIKYLERVMSLFHGRLSDFNDNPRKHLDQVMKDRTKEGQLTTNVNMEDDHSRKRLTNVEIVRDAFNLFQCHKRLFADRRLSLDVRRNTPKYFIRRTHEEAYKLLEIQLNFTYEAIYTKMVVIHKTTWKILRVVVLSLEVVGLVIWCLVGKQGYPHYDIRITYTLIVGAIAVDVFAFLRIQMSDWSIARLNEKPWWMIWMSWSGFYNMFLAARTQYNWNEADSSSTLVVWFRRVFLQRWSESIHQLDEVEVNQKDIKRRKVIEILGLEKFVWRYSGIVKRKRVSSDIWEFVFNVLKNHRNGGDDKNKYMVMVENGKEPEDIDSLVDRAFPTPTLEEDYLTAMSICKKLSDDGIEPTTSHAKDRKEISFALKEYISYLIIFQPNMMFGATDKNKLLTKTDDFFGRQEADEKYNTSSDEENSSNINKQRQDKYDHAKKVLDEIIKFKDGDEKHNVKWEFIARAWVKLVCYAAIKCRPNVHAKQLKQGGEFLSFVWLLMVHLDIKNLSGYPAKEQSPTEAPRKRSEPSHHTSEPTTKTPPEIQPFQIEVNVQYPQPPAPPSQPPPTQPASKSDFCCIS